MRGRCPLCGKETSKSDSDIENPFYPFCSERCRWIDLGHWLEGDYHLEVHDESESRTPSSLEGQDWTQNSIDPLEKL